MEMMTRPRMAGKFMMPDFVAETPFTAWNQIATKFSLVYSRKGVVTYEGSKP
jgi:hypothetical protein